MNRTWLVDFGVLCVGSSSLEAQRTRSVAVPKQGGGQECSGSGEETKTCSEQARQEDVDRLKTCSHVHSPGLPSGL